MRNRALIAALLATTCIGGPAFAADLGVPYKAPPPIPVSDWTGFYIGIEGGYAWGHNSFGAVTNFGPIFGPPDLSALLGTGGAIFNPAFVTSAPLGSLSQQGGVFGGFVGVQKQLSGTSWVLGLEADFDGASISKSAAATATEFGALATSLFIGPAPVVASGSGTAFIEPVTFSIPGQTITSTGTFTPSGSVSIAPVTVTIGAQTLTNPAQTLTVAAQTLTVSGQTLTIVGQTLSATPSFSGLPSTVIATTVISSVIASGTATVNVTFTLGTFTISPVSGSVTPVTLTVAGSTLTVTPTTLSLTASTLTVSATTLTTTAQTITISPTGSFSGSLATITVTGRTTVETITLPATTASVTVTVAGSTTGNVINVTQTTVDISRTVAMSTKIDELASVRGRIGFTPFTNWLFYGTGGLGLAHSQNTLTLTQTLFAPGTSIIVGGPSVFTSTSSSTLLGWTVGAGVDWKITPNLVIGAEYLHYDFPKNTISFSDNSTSIHFGNAHRTADAIKGRISWFVPLFP